MVQIIIRGKNKFGRTRSEQEENLRKEGWGGGMSDEELDKCKFLERKLKEEKGSKPSRIRQHHLTVVDEDKKK